MSANVIPVGARSAPFDAQITANGSYTLPKYAFIPNSQLRAISTGSVPAPSQGGPGGSLVLPSTTRRPYPVPVVGNIYGVRQAVIKTSS